MKSPLRSAPDPRFLYLSEAHREALAHLLYGIEQGEGFIAVTGEVGTGKTTLCRTLLRRLGGEVEVAFLFNPKLSAHELLEAILVELGVELKGDRKNGSVRELVDALNQFLLEKRATGKRVLLIVDEAQGLLPETLEQIRLLSNLETESDKLIQILLLGQPELDAMLESPELRQLRQRIGVRWRLAPLSRDETADYVRHRLADLRGRRARSRLRRHRTLRGVSLLGRHSAARESRLRSRAARGLRRERAADRRGLREARRRRAARRFGRARAATALARAARRDGTRCCAGRRCRVARRAARARPTLRRLAEWRERDARRHGGACPTSRRRPRRRVPR